MRNYLLCLFIFLTSTIVYSQKDIDVLLEINNESISIGEFKQVYLKNRELLQDNSKKDPAAYLELFIPYKLKVQEAYKQQLDKKESYVDEFLGYKKQLAKTFLTDVTLTDKMVKEAYNRLVTEVSARHILVKVAANATVSDTLAAYAKISEARDKILKGETFKKVAKKYSEDPSAQVNGGDLGWFKAFNMVYPFETAAYETEVNRVSKPFKTIFGYHIVQTKGFRKAEGAIQVAHIMILNNQKDKTINIQEKINKIYKILEEGQDFENLAKTYSEDVNTASNGGMIRQFERGQLSSKEFEDIAFALREEGEYSKPFKSKFGWHIAKLIERFPIKSFEDQKREIESRVKKDKRSQVISEALTQKLSKQYKHEDITSIVTLVKNKAVGTFNNGKWVFNTSVNNNTAPGFIIKDSVYALKGLGKYLERSYNPNNYKDSDTFFNENVRYYVDLKILEYHEEHLEEIESEFTDILREYKEGLLIFDLMDQEIWTQAKVDSVGLQEFYNANKANYKVAQKAIATTYTSQNKSVLESFRNNLTISPEKIQASIPSNVFKTAKDLIVNETLSYAPAYTPEVGVSTVLEYNNSYVFYDVSLIQPEYINSLDKARGQVISDYQDYLEVSWINKLRSNATISINKRKLKKLTKQLK